MKATSSLGDVVRAIRRGWLIIVVIAILGAGAGYAYVELSEPTYEATAVLTVEPLGSSPLASSSSDNVNMDTERVIASSSSVLGAATESIPGSTISELKDHLSVTVPKGSRVLEFTFSAETAEKAALGANEIAKAYQAQRTSNAQRVMDEAAAKLNDLVDSLESQLQDSDPDSNSRRVIELQIASIQEQLATLASATFYGGNLVSQAVAPREPSGPGALVLTVAGGAAGLLVGLFVALMRGRLQAELAGAAEEESSSRPPSRPAHGKQTTD